MGAGLISQIFKFFYIVYQYTAAFNFYEFFRFKITQGPDKRFGCCADILGDFLPGNFNGHELFPEIKFCD